MSNLNGLHRRLEKATAAIETMERAKNPPHLPIVIYDSETGEIISGDEHTGCVFLPAKEYLFNPHDDGCEP